MKTVLIVPAQFAREMLPNADTEQKLASGSYLIGIKPKKPTAHCIAQNGYLRRKREAGYKKLQVLLPEHIFNELRARCREGECMAELLERLLSNFDNDQNHMQDKQN